MFSPDDRTRLRKTLIEDARADDDVVGAALVGSAGTGNEDVWSDIDLVLQIGSHADPADVADRWTAQLYRHHHVAHHLDVVAGGVLYRVFLLPSSLQVDISFWPEDQFRATEPGFSLIFGTPQPATKLRPPSPEHEIGMAWLYALHSRSAIARGRTWQAVMMQDHLRDQLVLLACLRHGLNPHHGRGVDQLPATVLEAVGRARASSLTETELSRSHRALLGLLAREVRLHDDSLGQRLASPLSALELLET